MKKKRLYQVLALLIGLNSYSIALSSEGTEPVAAMAHKIGKGFAAGLSEELQATFSNSELSNKIAKESGKIFKEIMKESAIGGIEAFSEVAASGDFGQHATHGLRELSGQGADAIGNAEVQRNIARAGDELSSTIGKGTESMQKGLKKNFWPHYNEIIHDGIASMYNTRNAIQFGYPVALAATISITGYYGSRLAWKLLEKKLLDPRPDILLPGSKYGRWDRISRWRTGYKSPTMIFDQQVKDRLIEIQETTKNIRDHIYNGKKTTYNNLLLYGKPGTGKTLFAQILADETNMDFLPVTAASLLQSGVEGIKYFNELLDMAKRSKYGLIIFVDEADALFVERDNLSPSSDHYKVLNHILALTGTGSSKFMLIAATNHAYVMDAAMGRRFQDRVLMPLPDDATRTELFDLYINNVLFNEKNNSKEFVSVAQSLLTTQTINTLVEKTAELSHAEIKDAVHAMHKKALATKNGIITTTHIKSAVDQAVAKNAALQEDKIQREQHQQPANA